MGNCVVKSIDTTIVWFRFDLRTADNPALSAAAKIGSVVPVFIWSPDEEDLNPGAASRWWLHHSLDNFSKSLERIGGRLIIKSGKAIRVLKSLVKETNAHAVYWNRRYEPQINLRDEIVATKLKAAGVAVKTFKANLLSEPGEIENRSGLPYRVFTPFWGNCLKELNPPRPICSPRSFQVPQKNVSSTRLSELQLEPTKEWSNEMRRKWSPGEGGAAQNLSRFIKTSVDNYSQDRNSPDCQGTSRLSPHLRFGEIGPRQIWHALKAADDSDWKRSQFLAELGWREFGYHLLHHFPHTVNEPLKPSFNRFPWKNSERHLQAWQKGQTGYPLVDAGMRELCATGWMHNRVRMVAASFLVKHLLIHWHRGAEWFWDTLVDADLASNTQGWQWAAGCGADAAPYFRIFNPTIQAKKFDSNGDYIRRWVPELRHLSAPEIFEPRIAARAGLYPQPVVDHSKARTRALHAYERIK